MITAATRVSDALRERPDLRQTLPAFHPAFERLNHPVLGRILPRLVTVADAARIAGVDADVLVAVMNLPPGATLPKAKVIHREPSEPWAGPTSELDVRPLLDAGTEPLPAILAALRALPEGRGLAVVAPFEPVPLMGLLGRQGWASHVHWDGDVCRTTLYRGEVAVHDAPEVVIVEEEGGWSIDVRGLEPPEPMRRVLAAIDEGHVPLRVIHHREPALLYPRLAERGLTWTVTPGDPVEIRIVR